MVARKQINHIFLALFQLHIVERMGRDIHTDMSLCFAKVGYDKQSSITRTAQKGEQPTTIKVFVRLVGLHKVERFALSDSFLAIAEC